MSYILADDAIAALGHPKRGVDAQYFTPTSRRAFSNHQTKIRTARKFVLDDDFVRYAAVKACQMSPTQMLAMLKEYCRMPYPNIWLEWDEQLRCNAIQNYVVDSFENNADWFGSNDAHHPLWHTLLRETVKAAKNALDDENYLTKNVTERCGYLIEERTDNDALQSKEEAIFTCHFFIADTKDQSTALDSEKKLVSSPVGYAIKFDEPYSEEDHNRLLQDFQGNVEGNPYRYIDDAETTKSFGASKALVTLNSRWWSVLHHNDPWMGNYYAHMRPVQCEPIYWWCNTEKSFEPHILQLLTEKFSNSLEGDPRFVITVLSLLNYDWILKDNQVRSKTQRRRFGRRVSGNTYSIVSIDLPKRKGIEVFMRDFDKDSCATRRLHEVRGHWCVSKTTKKRWWRKSHKRGDANLGVISHDYELNHSTSGWNHNV